MTIKIQNTLAGVGETSAEFTPMERSGHNGYFEFSVIGTWTGTIIMQVADNYYFKRDETPLVWEDMTVTITENLVRARSEARNPSTTYRFIAHTDFTGSADITTYE